MYSEILDLTKELVAIRSVNGTPGERKVSDFIYYWFQDLPYFREHPENLIFQPVPDDSLNRGSVIAIVEGKKKSCKKTLLLHGHTDTVGTGDYGPLEDVCTDPDALAERLSELTLSDEVKADLESGNFLFGRGAVDMKSGDAVFMALLAYFSDHTDEIEGNLIGSFNPVEENTHTGIITSLPLFLKLEEERGFEYIGAINNDFSTKLYPGDDKVTLYTGAGGKILPCFYVRGKETHVGQPFEGLDASALAAELVKRINLSTELSDFAEGETAPPPAVLKLKDLKDFYNVQTAKEALVYFNFYVFESDMRDITEGLASVARKAAASLQEDMKKNYSIYCHMNHLPETAPEEKVSCLSYSELYSRAANTDAFSDDELDRLTKEELEKGTDEREIPIVLIRYLLGCIRSTEPVIVLYYAPPYVPHCCVDREDGGTGQALYTALSEAAAETESEGPYAFRILNYYPSLSDSSYLKIDDEEGSLEALTENFPAFETLYPLPLDDIRALDIPAINIGTYGSDAHKWTERVNIPYTFGTLPDLEKKVILKLIGT